MFKLKVLYFITSLGRGGAEKQVCDLVDNLGKFLDETCIVILINNIEIYPKNKCQIVNLGLDPRKPFTLINAIKKYCDILKNYKPDIVHSHNFHPNIIARIIRIFNKNAKVISTAHSSNEGGLLRMLSYRITNHLASAFTIVSHTAKSSFVAKFAASGESIIVVPNGIDIDKYTYKESDRFNVRKKLLINSEQTMILAIGRLVPEKNFSFLIDVAKVLLVTQKNICLIILGSGPDYIRLKSKIESQKLADHIKIVNAIDDVSPFLSAADIFVVTSKYEGFSLVTAEAITNGLKVVTTNCGGPAEIMNGGHGEVVEDASPRLFADALLRQVRMNKLKIDRNENINIMRER